MEIKDFFDFESKLVSTTFQVSAVGLNKGKNEHSEYYDQHMLILGNYSDITFPVVFKQGSGKKLQDMLDTCWPSLYLISDRMKAVLEEEGLTGWKSYPVRVFDKHDDEIFGYHGFSVTGRCGMIDYSKSEVVMRQFAPNGPIVKYYKGLYVGLDTWDGSDFFLPEKNLGTVVTKRVVDILKKHKLTNIRFENLADIEISASTVQVAIENQNREW
jgi:hypothetical protein